MSRDKTTLPFTGLEVAAATAFLGAMGDRHYSDLGKGAGCGLLLRCIRAAIGAADAYRQREAAEFEASANLDEARRRQAMWDEVDWP